MNRRTFLGAAGAGVSASLAGCTDAFGLFGETTYGREPPLVDDRPEAIYVPTHTEQMKDAGMGVTDDGLHVHLMYTFPHRFWRVFRRDDGEGYESRIFEVGPDDAVHIMAGVWDDETGAVLPVSGVDIAARGGDGVDERETVYPMLSQRMGFHYGDNYHLDGDGTYEVDVTVGGVDVARFGDFEGRFEEPATVSIEIEYDEGERNDLEIRTYEDRQGEPGAVEPIDSEMPLGFARDLGGEPMGEGLADDVRYRAALLDDERFGEEPYLAVTASTRYNDLVIPHVGLAARAEAEGEPVLEERLSPGLDPEIGFHYGVPSPGLGGGETVTIEVTTPAQVARHEGYETAFLDAPTVALE